MWTHVPLTDEYNLSWIPIDAQNQELLYSYLATFTHSQDVRALMRDTQMYKKTEMILCALVFKVSAGPAEVSRHLTTEKIQKLTSLETPGFADKNRIFMFALALQLPYYMRTIIDISLTHHIVSLNGIEKLIIFFVRHIISVASASQWFLMTNTNKPTDQLVMRSIAMNQSSFGKPQRFREFIQILPTESQQLLFNFERAAIVSIKSRDLKKLGQSGELDTKQPRQTPERPRRTEQFKYSFTISEMADVMKTLEPATLSANTWTYEQLDDTNVIGYVMIDSATLHHTNRDVWVMFLEKMTQSCKSTIAESFNKTAFMKASHIIIIGCFQPARNLPINETLESYSLPDNVPNRHRFIEAVQAMKAPVVNDLVCSSIIVGHLSSLELPMKDMRLGFLHIDNFAQCDFSETLRHLLEYTEYAVQQIGESRGFDKVVFSTIEANRNQIEYIQQETDYKQVNNVDPLVHCRLFGFPALKSTVLEPGSGVTRYCAATGIIFYKPLMSLEIVDHTDKDVNWVVENLDDRHTIASIQVSGHNKAYINELISETSRNGDTCFIKDSEQVTYFAMLLDTNGVIANGPEQIISGGGRVICQTVYMPVFYQGVVDAVIFKNVCISKLSQQDDMPRLAAMIDKLSYNKHAIVELKRQQADIADLLQKHGKMAVIAYRDIPSDLFDSDYFNLTRDSNAIILQKLKPGFVPAKTDHQAVGRQRKASFVAPYIDEHEFDDIKWQYEKIDDNFTIGFITMHGKLTELQCAYVEMFIRKFSQSCQYIPSSTFEICKHEDYSLLFVLLYAPPQIAPEDRPDTYRMRGDKLLDDESIKKILVQTDAPIIHGLVGLSFILGTIAPLGPPDFNYAYYESIAVSRCPSAYNKYKSTIPGQVKVTATLLGYAEKIARNYGITELKYTEVPFAILRSVRSAYFFYLKHAGYTQITEPNELLNCEAFDTRTQSGSLWLHDGNEGHSVDTYCSGTLILMYKPLVEQ